MNFSAFQDASKFFSVVLFIQEEDFDSRRTEIEALGKQKNVRLVIQPCPFEGIEFLYRVGHELIGHQVSVDNQVFWQAIELKRDTPPDVFARISEHHHNYLVAILEQDTKKVSKEGKVLESLADYYV